MQSLASTTIDALSLLFSGDVALWEIIGISFRVSCTAILITSPFALGVAFILAYFNFIGRRLLISIFSTLLAFPAVVVGLVVYILLSNHGPLGDWRLLFSQTAMIIAQIILCLPILISMSHAAFQANDHHAWETARTLGIPGFRAFLLIIYEVKFGLLAAFLAGFGRIIAEVGASMMVGGNILHHTRNIPTAIALETSKGNFSQGIALGIVLLLLAFILNILLQYFQGRGHYRHD
ncbi:ABC transporter permease [Candidatus Spongiihabitans sp.]|uniref:ABC transporter permease n=1 Tax=Candidatus Spongiihabitans sp. TaxID=3101308 RepID=UPI003C7CA3B0